MKTAILKEDFETRILKKKVQGKDVEEVVPKYKKGQKFEVITLSLYWMTPEEKGGLGVNLSCMDYLRLTYPDGTPTKYYSLFEIVDNTTPDSE